MLYGSLRTPVWRSALVYSQDYQTCIGKRVGPRHRCGLESYKAMASTLKVSFAVLNADEAGGVSVSGYALSLNSNHC